MAVKEYEDIIEYYSTINVDLARKIIEIINDRLSTIQKHPKMYPQKNRKGYREVCLIDFPFNLVYKVNDAEKQVLVITIFHERRNPRLKFKVK